MHGLCEPTTISMQLVHVSISSSRPRPLSTLPSVLFLPLPRQLLVFQRAPYLGLWENPGYYALWVIQRIVLLGFWLFTSYGVIGAFSTQQFDPWAIVKGDLVVKPREGEVGDEVILPVSSGRSGTAGKSHHPSPSRTGMQ